jgi:aldose 1-epimerase
VVTVGGALAGLTWQGHDLVVPAPPDHYAPGYLGKVLLPWPNRVRDGRYRWAGRDHVLAVNEAGTACALHGLVCWVAWDVAAERAHEVTLTTDIYPQPGYPFRLRAAVTYRLDPAEGLTTTLQTSNLGMTSAPYGAAVHPYLVCGTGPIDACTVDLPASRVVVSDERHLPRQVVAVEGTDLDFRGGRVLGPQRLDHAFTGMPSPSSGWTAYLARPGTPWRVALASNTPWLQVYTADGELARCGVAVEPMTCPADAFNSGTDVVALGPGARHTLISRICAEPTRADGFEDGGDADVAAAR